MAKIRLADRPTGTRRYDHTRRTRDRDRRRKGGHDLPPPLLLLRGTRDLVAGLPRGPRDPKDDDDRHHHPRCVEQMEADEKK